MNILRDYAFWGAVAGLIIGALDYAVIRIVLNRAAGARRGAADRDTVRRAQIIDRIVQLVCFIVMPAAGWWAGTVLAPAFAK